MAKQLRMSDVDRISKLPDAILSHILSFLSTKEAVGTSILSTRWRYLFALVSSLDFELDDQLFLRRKKPKTSTIKSFVSFVCRVLFLHNATSIEKFHLTCGEAVDSSHVYGWLSAALWRGVQHLDLNISGSKFTTLPGVLFTCRTLVTLKLNIAFVLNVPNDVRLPNLKTFHLKSIEFLGDDSVKRLFSSCTSLEDMVMEDCNLANINSFNVSHNLLKRLTIVRSQFRSSTSNYQIVIDAPMLVYFKYNDYEAASYSFQNLKSLVEADIDFFLLEGGSIANKHNLANTAPFFSGISNVQSLNLSSSSLKLLLSYEPVPVFLNMIQLKISPSWPARFFNVWDKGLATLLRVSPELKKLAFNQEVFSYLPHRVPFCLSLKLKESEISEFKAEKDCIEKAKYFLKNAGVLEKLTISTRCLGEKGKRKITEELLASPRKSKQCCIMII